MGCPADCRAPSADGWFQVRGGHVFANQGTGEAIASEVPGSTCGSASCIPALMGPSRSLVMESTGIPITGGGTIDSNSYLSYRDPDISLTSANFTRVRENYGYFYRRYSIGLSPEDDFTVVGGNDPTNATKPTYDDSKQYYFHSGDMTIQQRWTIDDGESYVIFIDGNLTITDPTNVENIIDMPGTEGFIAFIVSGNITIDDNVGNDTITSDAGNVEGMFLADGTLTVESNGGTDERFIGEGSFIGLTGVSLNRDLSDANNQLYPGELFYYRPALMANVPQKMKRSQVLWQETN